MVTTDPGAKFSVSVSTGVTGQTGTLAVQMVLPGEGHVAIPRTTVGVQEFPAGSGVYGADLVAPRAPGLYMLIWDTAGGGPLTPANTFTETVAVNFERPEFYEGDVAWPYGPHGFGIVPGAEVSDAPPGSNPIPTAADVRAASSLTWTDYGAGLGVNEGPSGLQEVVNRAESAFYNITGQTLDSIDVKFAPQVRRVIQGMTEQLAMAGSEDTLSTQSDWDLVSSFSAGPYNESHRSPADMIAGRMLFPVPWISMALWALLTPDRYAFWMSFFTGVNQPAFAVTDVFWEDGQILGSMYGPAGLDYFGGA